MVKVTHLCVNGLTSSSFPVSNSVPWCMLNTFSLTLDTVHLCIQSCSCSKCPGLYTSNIWQAVSKTFDPKTDVLHINLCLCRHPDIMQRVECACGFDEFSYSLYTTTLAQCIFGCCECICSRL